MSLMSGLVEHMSVTQALRKSKEGNHEFKSSLSYIVSKETFKLKINDIQSFSHDTPMQSAFRVTGPDHILGSFSTN